MYCSTIANLSFFGNLFSNVIIKDIEHSIQISTWRLCGTFILSLSSNEFNINLQAYGLPHRSHDIMMVNFSLMGVAVGME